MDSFSGRTRLPDWTHDGLLALLVAAMQVQGTVSRAHSDPRTVLRPLDELGHLGYLLLVLSGLSLVARRRHPTVVLGVTAAASAAYYLADLPDGPGWVALFVALYTLTATGDGRRSVALAGVAIVSLSAVWLVAASNVEPRAAVGWVFFRIGASVMSAALGESVRSRRVIAEEAIRRAELAEHTREEEAQRRVTDERLRIAREVHDTVAHAIAVINVQAGVTRHVMDKKPEEVQRTLEVIERTSSRALREMRTILEVLRSEDDRTPQRGLSDIDELIAHARSAGLTVAAPVIDGPAELDAIGNGVPSTVAAASYRVVQEALTNVLRHVGPSPVTISLTRRPRSLDVVIRNEVPAAPVMAVTTSTPAGWRDAGSRQGILGMTERVELLGGRLEAGPADGGFEVRATFPLAVDELVST